MLWWARSLKGGEVVDDLQQEVRYISDAQELSAAIELARYWSERNHRLWKEVGEGAQITMEEAANEVAEAMWWAERVRDIKREREGA